jgi:hypothetical protein
LFMVFPLSLTGKNADKSQCGGSNRVPLNSLIALPGVAARDKITRGIYRYVERRLCGCADISPQRSLTPIASASPVPPPGTRRLILRLKAKPRKHLKQPSHGRGRDEDFSSPPHRSRRALLTHRAPRSGQTSCDERFSHVRRPARSHYSDRRGVSAQCPNRGRLTAVPLG